jgi:hypothetical protein
MKSLIQDYKFNKQYASTRTLKYLFQTLIGLIEVQRNANLYRSGCKNHALQSSGICSNLDYHIPFNSISLTDIFFNGASYPITPFSPVVQSGTWIRNSNYEVFREFRWGHNDIGNKRMKLLELMIKDLTNYLTKEAM